MQSENNKNNEIDKLGNMVLMSHQTHRTKNFRISEEERIFEYQ